MIVAQEVIPGERIWVLFSNGNTFEVTKAIYAAIAGNRTQKVAELRARLVAACGDADSAEFMFELDAQGGEQRFEWNHPRP